jgi:hypothetical protein
MKYAVERDSCAMMYILSFIKIGAGIQKLIWGGGGGLVDTHTTWRTNKPAFIFENKENKLKVQFTPRHHTEQPHTRDFSIKSFKFILRNISNTWASHRCTNYDNKIWFFTFHGTILFNYWQAKQHSGARF